MATYKIQVRVPETRKTAFGDVLTGRHRWEFGRPTNGPDYEYPTREQAITAARLWGDAYDRGGVRVVEIHVAGDIGAED